MASSTFPVHRSYGGSPSPSWPSFPGRSPSPSWPVTLCLFPAPCPGVHRRHHGRFPFPRQVAVFRRVPGDHRRHHGRLAFPREITVAIMAGYPLLVELENVGDHRRHHGRLPFPRRLHQPASRSLSGGSPSPSWPVPLSQTSCGFS